MEIKNDLTIARDRLERTLGNEIADLPHDMLIIKHIGLLYEKRRLLDVLTLVEQYLRNIPGARISPEELFEVVRCAIQKSVDKGRI